MWPVVTMLKITIPVSVEVESGRKRQKLKTMYEYSRYYILDKNKTIKS